jgi:hypothetical protein
MSNDLGGRRPRPAANTVNSPPMGSGVAILVTAVALILGFLILHKVNDNPTTTSGGGGGSETTNTTPSTGTGGDTSSTASTVPGVFTGTKVQVANCSAQNGVARMMSSALGDAGFTMADPTTGTCDPKLTTSYVIYNAGTPGAIDVANTVAKILGNLKVETGTVPLLVETAAWADGSAVLLYLGNDLAGKTIDQIQGVAVTGTTTPPAAVTTPVTA